MRVEDSNALRFILQDEIYLLDEDKNMSGSAPVSQSEIQTRQPAFNYLGSNKKNFLILVSYDEYEFMQEDHLTALESVLGRLGHTREDVAILNISRHRVDHERIVAHFKPTTVIVLGKSAMPEGADLKFNTVSRFNGIKTLLTFAFDEMMTDVGNKKVFWEQMKNL